MLMSGGRVFLLGIVATAVMDILGTLAQKAHVIAPLPPTLLGRWFASIARGQLRHASIEKAAPVGHELVIALLVHYLVGVVFASLYLFATSQLDVSPRSAGAAMTFGLATCVFPWLLMFPAMGFGLFGRRGPPGTQLLRSSLISHVAYGVGIWLASVVTAACTSNAHPATHVAAATSNALILDSSDGERRLHRPPPGGLSNLTAPFILKVDRRNGGAPEFVMLTEDIPPGQGISPHRHPHSDEIIFIHGGTGLATLAGRQATVTTGATIYMPRNTVVGLRNTGTEPLKIVAIFSQPGYEEYLREISVPEGQIPAPLSVEELSAIRARHANFAVYEKP